ncbi:MULTISPECIES: TetR/AcrR family transcriptional regulator [unclassified Nocardia]|uniref:TetR/AcrR family transcriptional regulator n=1 Tax=unclassified Nocardia TaxID=2637762 RepID=UPI001CE42354|nr:MULTISPECIES: TetR/AcrR family transcriptional regulator [unclassified Nocardia]
MTTKTRMGRPPTELSPASLNQILSAALNVFAECGFDGTSVAALNRELGVSHNLIHQRFGSKEGLWYATVDWAFGQIADHMASDPMSADPLEAAHQTIVRFLRLHSTHPQILRLVTVEGATEGPRLTYLFDAHVGPLHARITAPLKVLVDRGVLAESDIRTLHFLVAHGATAPFSLVPLAKRLNPLDPLDPDAVRQQAEFVADLLVAGLRARGA